MKKTIVLIMIMGLFLVGCSRKIGDQPAQMAQGPGREEVLSRLLDREDLDTYILSFKSYIGSLSESGEKRALFQTSGLEEKTKEPRLYHRVWRDQDEEGNLTVEREEYISDKARVYRQGGGEWEKDLFQEKKDQVATFKPEREMNFSRILETLKDYFSLDESGEAYSLTFTSTGDNIKEVQKILFEEMGENTFPGQVQSLNVDFTYEKETYYPRSYKMEMEFFDGESKEVLEIKQSGTYEKVNQVDKIDLPQEIKEYFQ